MTKDQREQQAREHELKTWSKYFKEVLAGKKNFEIRENDRNFQIGDILWLREYDKETNSYSGREIKKKVTYVLDTGGEFGLEKGNVCMGLTDFSTHIDQKTKTCKWTHDEHHYYYKTECGEGFSFIEGDLKENNHKYCPFCGGKITQ